VFTALPTEGLVGAFEPISAEGFVLEKQLDSESRGVAEELAAGSSRVSLSELLDHADRETVAVARALGGRAHGYRWDREDVSTTAWYPQGITGSADAHPSGLVAGREVHLVSWYSKQGKGVRVSFVDVAARRYRHVLCVRPTGDREFEPVGVHAGGIVWVGNLLLVADTRRGLRVFDTDHILRLPGDDYVIPQVGAYRNNGEALSFSFASLDRSDPAMLTVGEYAKKPGRVVRWPVDLSSGLLSSATATEAFRAPVNRLQGVAEIAGHLVASASRRGGRLYVGRPGERCREHVWWPYLPEDLLFVKSAGEVHSLTEDPGARLVFSVPIAQLGL